MGFMSRDISFDAVAPESLKLRLLKYLLVVVMHLLYEFRLCEMWKLHHHKGAMIFVVTMLVTPGFMFFGKVISPEYIIILPILSAVFLYRDNGKFQTFYLIALFFAWLALLSKISTAPLLFMIIVYGVVYPILLNYPRKQYGKLLGKILLVSLVVLLVVLIYCWGSSVFSDIQLAFTLVSSWNIDSVTWDQIKIGGLYIDFLPVFVFSAIVLLLLIIPSVDKEVRVTSFVIICSAILMLVSSVFHNSGHTWYFFTAFSLFSVASAYLIPERGS